MTVGERIKEIRKSKKISVDYIAKELGISKTTIYRYEDSTIEKIPLTIFDKLCQILEVSPAELTGNVSVKTKQPPLPEELNDAQDAMEFLIKIPSIAAFGGYNPQEMSNETIVAFANEILQQLKLVSYKYKDMERD